MDNGNLNFQPRRWRNRAATQSGGASRCKELLKTPLESVVPQAIKRLLYRSKQRGFLELDLLMV